MTREHVTYFDSIGFPVEKVQRVLDHLIATEQAWCFVDGQILDRSFCERYLATARDGKERKRYV